MSDPLERDEAQAPAAAVPTAASGPRRRLPFGRRALVLVACALLAAAFALDWITGSEVASSLFYVVTVAFAAWFVGRVPALVLALVSVAAWWGAHEITAEPFSKPSILYWNLFGEFGTYVVAALAVAQTRSGVERAHALARRLEQSNRALDRETSAVGDLQRQLLPDAPPPLPGYAWETVYLTSTRAGGDYYDFFALPDGRVGILVADASGHGAPAAVLMAMARVLLHAGSDPPARPEAVLGRLNAQLAGNVPPGWFMTACYVALDPGSGRIEYSLAGHDPPVALRASGEVRRLAPCGGLPLGLFAQADYAGSDDALGPGDTLLLHTDGVTEAMGPTQELFGEERLIEVLRRARGADLEGLRASLVARLEAHRAGAPLSDDLTLLLLRRND